MKVLQKPLLFSLQQHIEFPITEHLPKNRFSLMSIFSKTSIAAILSVFSFSMTLPAEGATLFEAILSSDQEVAPGGATNSPATGFATLELDPDQTELAYSITVFDVDFSDLVDVDSPTDPLDVATLLHFHQAPRGENGPVVFGIFGPEQDLDDRTVSFNASDNSTTISGVWDLDDPANEPLSTFVPELLATGAGVDTNLYLNLHSVNDAAGIIRGQVFGVADPAAVPEPTSMLGLLSLACLGTGSILKKKA